MNLMIVKYYYFEIQDAWTIVRSLKEDLALHSESIESEVFFQWTEYIQVEDTEKCTEFKMSEFFNQKNQPWMLYWITFQNRLWESIYSRLNNTGFVSG